jgi:hypothetical protein
VCPRIYHVTGTRVSRGQLDCVMRMITSRATCTTVTGYYVPVIALMSGRAQPASSRYIRHCTSSLHRFLHTVDRPAAVAPHCRLNPTLLGQWCSLMVDEALQHILSGVLLSEQQHPCPCAFAGTTCASRSWQIPISGKNASSASVRNPNYFARCSSSASRSPSRDPAVLRLPM